MIYEEMTHKIISCAMKVHSTMGNGYSEVIYQRAMNIELTNAGLKFQREMKMDVYYDNEIIGIKRVDFFVEKRIMVELKAVIDLNNYGLNQCRNYLEIANQPVGLLINFGSKSLQFKRIYNSKHPESRL
jgi:GxxExxY protein